MAISTARLFRTGSVPGRPRHTGQTLVFGGSPKRVEQLQKILVLVRSGTWTSRPMTGSYFARISGAREAVSEADLAIKKHTLKHRRTKGTDDQTCRDGTEHAAPLQSTMCWGWEV